MVMEKIRINAERFAELLEKPEYENMLLELVQGEIVEMSKPTGMHGEVAFLIGLKLGNFVYEHGLGRMTAAETGFILAKDAEGKDTVRGLDCAFISIAKAPKPLENRLVDIAPDLAVEVISPGNTAEDIDQKIHELLEAGTPLIWIVYPKTLSVAVHTTKGSISYSINDTLTGGDVLPGFTLPVRDIFPK
jgi:Uma2 family endonuclease